MKKIKKKFNQGVVLLFAITLSAVLLALAMGVTSIAEKEVRFGTSAKTTGNAFLAADTGVECAIYHDKSSDSVFPLTGQETSIDCGGTSIPINYSGGVYDFVVSGLGSDSSACAKVTVTKDNTANPLLINTTIISKGYNTGDTECNSSQANRAEREIEVTYTVDNPSPTGGTAVIWTNDAGVSVDSNNLTKTAGAAWGNAGASSLQSLTSGDGYVEFTTADGGVNVMAGLSNGDSNQSYTDIDFAIHLQGPPACGSFCTGDNIWVWENGVCKYGNPSWGCTTSALNPYTPGDKFKVAIESGAVNYYKNGVLFYTSSSAPNYPIIVDSALYETDSTITDAVVSGFNSGSFLVDSSGTLADNLVAYWKMDEASGTRFDSVGTNNLSDNNGVEQAAGKMGESAKFTAAASRFLSNLGSFAQVGDSSFTFAGWFFFNSSTPMIMIGKDDGTASEREYRLRYLGGSTNVVDFAVYRSGIGQITVSATNFGQLVTNRWYFITAWHDAAADTVSISVNNGTPNSVATGGALQTTTNASMFTVGSREFPASPTYTDGVIDELGFWNRVLTPQERTDLYNSGSGNTYNP